jgi:hypothetical protein
MGQTKLVFWNQGTGCHSKCHGPSITMICSASNLNSRDNDVSMLRIRASMVPRASCANSSALDLSSS